MSELKQTLASKQRMHTSSQSSDDFLQQFPAPPVTQHFSDSDESIKSLDNGHHQMNEKTQIGSNAPKSNNNSITTSAAVQKPNDIDNNALHRRSNNVPASILNATQVQSNVPNVHALNTDFKFVDRSGKKAHWTKRNCLFRWICCSMCFPPWVSCVIWFVIIAVIICIIVIGAILGSFKMPTVEFAGLNPTLPSGTQQIQFSSTGFVINAGLILNVINPNILDLKLSNLTAKVYYPINGTMVQIGKGYLDYQFIPKKNDINFTYPFEIDYSPTDPNSKYLLTNISDKCGFTGNTLSNIDIGYDVSFNAQVLFVHVSHTISSTTSFACPFQDGQMPGLSTSSSDGGGLGAVLGGLGAQVNGTTTSTIESTSTSSSMPLSLTATAMPLSTTTTVPSSTIISAIVNTTSIVPPFTILSTISNATTALTNRAAVPSSSASMISNARSAVSIVPTVVPTSTFVVPITSITKSSIIPASTSILVVPTSVTMPLPIIQSRLILTSSQYSTSSLPHVHSSLITSTTAKPSTVVKSNAPRPIPSSLRNNDEDANDDEEDYNEEDDDKNDDNYQV